MRRNADSTRPGAADKKIVRLQIFPRDSHSVCREGVVLEEHGDEASLERLLGQFRPYLRAIAERDLPPALQAKLDASDLAQETLLRGYREFDQYRGTGEQELKAWLTGILRNYLIDVKRGFLRDMRDVRREQPFVDIPCPGTLTASDAARRTESQERLQHAMQSLTAEHRQVLDLRQYHGLSFSEIGTRMNRSSDAARMLWGRAIVQLGNVLREHVE